MPPNNWQKIQYAVPEDTAPQLDQKQSKYIQDVTETFLHYAHTVDGTMVTALSALSMEQAKPTTRMLQHAKQFLDYVAINSEATSTYQASNMVLAIHSDASYLHSKKHVAGQRGNSYPTTPHFPQTMAQSIT